MKSLSISSQEKYSIISSLATFLASGIPILESIDSILEESKGNTKKILIQLKQDLEQGKTLAYSLARNPNAFDPITVNLIKGAEESGTLEDALKDLTVSIQKDIDFMDKVKGSLVYPSLVVLVLLAVIILNLFFVIPRVAQVFSRLKIDVPLPTQILISTSNFVNDNLILAIIAIAILISLIIVTIRVQKPIISRLLFSLPLVSKLITEIDLTRFSRSLALLLKAGIPIDEALTLSANVVSKKQIKKVIEDTLKQVTQGNKISVGLKNTPNVIPSFMLRIIEAGEKSGTLEQSFQSLSNQLEKRVENRLKTLTLLIEPFLLIFVGLIVGALMLAIIAPIYNLIGQIGQR